MTIKLGCGFSETAMQDRVQSIFPAELIAASQILPCNGPVQSRSSFIESVDDYTKIFKSDNDLIMTINANSNVGVALKYLEEHINHQERLYYIINYYKIEAESTLTPLPDDIATREKVINANDLLKDNLSNFYAKYGESYISDIAYGKRLSLVVKFEYINEGSRQETEGSIKAKALDLVEMKTEQNFNQKLSTHKLKCDIKLDHSGFDNSKPPVAPLAVQNNLVKMKEWVDQFMETIPDTPIEEARQKSKNSSEQQPSKSSNAWYFLGFKPTDYSKVLDPDAAGRLNEKVTEYLRHESVVEGCLANIKHYKAYLATIDSTQQTKVLVKDLSRYEQQLIDITRNLKYSRKNVNLDQLRLIIAALNGLQDLKDIRHKRFSNMSYGCLAEEYKYSTDAFSLAHKEPLMFSKISVCRASRPNPPSAALDTLGRVILFASNDSTVPYNWIWPFDKRSTAVSKDLTIEDSAIDFKRLGINFDTSSFAFHLTNRGAADVNDIDGVITIEYEPMPPILEINPPKKQEDEVEDGQHNKMAQSSSNDIEEMHAQISEDELKITPRFGKSVFMI